MYNVAFSNCNTNASYLCFEHLHNDRRVSDLKQRATFSLFSFFSSELSTTSAGMPYNPFRFPKHFQLDDYIEAGWDEVDAKLYLDAIQQSFELPNSVMDLRVPYALESSEDKRGFFRAYVHHFNELYRHTQNATSDDEAMYVMEAVIADLDQEIHDWITTHDIRVPSSPTYWTGEIEEVYRRSFGIPLRAEPMVENEVPVSVAISGEERCFTIDQYPNIHLILFLFSLLIFVFLLRCCHSSSVSGCSPYYP